MKYNVTLDSRGYVLSIAHTGTKLDYVDLNLDDYDFTNNRKRAYRLGKNKLVFDEAEYKRIKEEEQKKADNKEIAELQQKLNETDYIMARWGEELISLDNALTWVADAIKINLKYAKQYRETLANRKTWRERIEKLRK